MVMEQFISATDKELVLLLREKLFKTLKETATWADDHVLAHRSEPRAGGGSKEGGPQEPGGGNMSVLVPHVPLPVVTVLVIRAGLGSLNPPLPLQDQREGQEEKLLLVPQSTITSLRAITAMPRGIFDLNAQNL